jgi:hypothetical protein
MNCQDFENRLDALARGALADARTREEASAHTEACARCAARLADERALTEGLRALASELKAAEAPARVEPALLAALRARAASGALAGGVGVARVGSANVAQVESASGTALAGRDNTSTLAGRAVARRWSWMKTVAVASLAAAAVLTLFMLIPSGTSVPAPGKTGEVAATHRSDAGNDEPTNKQKDSAKDIEDETGGRATLADRRAKPPRVNFVSRQAGRAVAAPAVYNAGATRGSRSGGGVIEGASAEEIVTDFIPLMQGGRFTQGDGGRLVRVELPRSALASFGLPVNAEAAGGRVKADVLLGDDGLARAIRFVH